MNTAHQESIGINYYIAFASRERWFLIVPFCVAMTIGCVLAIKLPRVYEASTLILIQHQRVPERIVSPVVNTDIESRIGTISQQIRSRTNLERVMKEFDLSLDPVLMEDKVAALRGRIKVDLSRTANRRETEAFSISFQDGDPSTAMKVANGLATFFIDENLRMREAQAVGTTDFLEAELASIGRRLEEKEITLKEYRQENMGELPEQLQANLNLLDRLNAQLAQSRLSLRTAQVGLASLETEVAGRQSISEREFEDSMSLPQLKDRLSSLRSVYTEQHPDIIRLKARISLFKTNKRAIDVADTASRRILLIGAIRGLEGEIERVSQEIKQTQMRVDVTPKREQELISLTRDYDNIKATYKSLLDRKLEADISVNMERKQRGEQFQVIDPARLPEKPVLPDMKRLFMITSAVGLGVGLGLAFLHDHLGRSNQRDKEEIVDSEVKLQISERGRLTSFR
jgi:polysaccharide chain length determinant protein (PEP-CTERM system associated)